MFLWFIISFLSKKRSWMSWMLTYVKTLGCSLLSIKCLEKVICKGWLGVPTKGSPSSDVKLGIVQITDQGGSWIKTMSKFLLFSRIISVSSLFFQTFCENILRFLQIIYSPHPQLSRLKALDTFSHATPCWTYVSIMDKCCCWLDAPLYNWCTWKSAGKALLSLFQAYTTPCHLPVMFDFVWTVTLDAFHPLPTRR